MENEILEQPQIEGKWVVITTKFNCQSYPLNDKAIFVSDEDLEAIADFFNVELDYLCGRTDEKPDFSLEEQ